MSRKIRLENGTEVELSEESYQALAESTKKVPLKVGTDYDNNYRIYGGNKGVGENSVYVEGNENKIRFYNDSAGKFVNIITNEELNGDYEWRPRG